MKYKIITVQYVEGIDLQISTAYTSTMSHIETAIAAFVTDISIREMCITEISNVEERTIFKSYRS